MRSKIIFIVSGIGLVLALISAYLAGQEPKPLPPAFNPAANPYAKGIYAQGIIESAQAHGENINIYPEVSGPITEVLVAEGAKVRKGDALLRIDDSVQRATAEQQQAQAEAARAMLAELKAEPRRENLEVAAAQVDNAKAGLKNAEDQLAKVERAYSIEPKSVSRDALDNARNAEKIAATNLEVVEKQYALIKAGAWTYDIQNQEKTVRRAVEGLCVVRGAALEIHHPRAGRRCGAIDSSRRGQLCVLAGRLRQLHPGDESAHRDGRAGRSPAGARLHR